MFYMAEYARYEAAMLVANAAYRTWETSEDPKEGDPLWEAYQRAEGAANAAWHYYDGCVNGTMEHTH